LINSLANIPANALSAAFEYIIAEHSYYFIFCQLFADAGIENRFTYLGND